MSFSVISGALASAVAPAGTFTASYPSGKNAGSFFLAMGHKLSVGGNMLYFPVDFDVTLNVASITITNKSATYTWPQGAAFRLQMEELGDRTQITVPMESPNAVTCSISGASYSINARSKLVASSTQGYLDVVTLGAPAAIVANGIATAQNVSAGNNMTLNGSLASGGTVTLDVPRAVIVDSGGADTAVLTVTGTDVYGRPMSEAITLNGTTAVPGKKAFKTITSISSSATTANSPFVGTSDILGLPLFLPSVGFVLKELRDGAVVSAGTLVAGIRTAGGSTTTTGDVRGTYTPANPTTGSGVIQLIIAVTDRNAGIAQNVAGA